MPIRILLIEDNPDHTLVTKRILAKTGKEYLLDSTIEGSQGLKRVAEEDYDLIISDYINDLYFIILVFNLRDVKFGVAEYYLQKVVKFIKEILNS